MQAVSATFSGAMNSPWRQLDFGVLISWQKTVASGINFFTIGSSVIGGTDIIATSQPGTIAQAGQFAYQSIPASGVVSWQTTMKLDQFPYGMVQRQADVVLNNAGAQYLPASGTQFGPYQQPSRPMIISAGFGQETIPMFTGYSDTPVNDIKARTTTLHGYDAISYINAFTSTTTPPFVNQTVNTIMNALLLEMGFAPNQFVLELSQNTIIPYLDPYGQLVGRIFSQFCEAEAGIMFADESGIIHFWNRQHFANNVTPVWTLTYSNMETLSQQNTTLINSVNVQSAPLALLSGIQNVYSLQQPYYVPAGRISGLNKLPNPSLESGISSWVGQFSVESNDAAYGVNAASGTNIIYSGIPAIDYTGSQTILAFNFNAKMPNTVSGIASLIVYDHNAINRGPSMVISGSNQWQQYGLTFNTANTGPYGPVYFALSGLSGPTHGLLMDAVSDNNMLPYFDGSFPSTNAQTYSWSGANNIGWSVQTAIPQYLAIQVNLGFDTYVLNPPVASGLNSALIGVNQSFFSFSSISGVGGIFGTDLTANMSLVSYSVSGSKAWLIWQNNSPTQAYLTNLQLYGQVADSPANIIDEVYSNTASIRQFGMNPSNNGQVVNINNNYVPTSLYAQSLAQYLVTNYSTPLLRHTTDNFVVPPLQFGDACNLFNRDTGETRVAIVLGITNRMAKNAEFTQQLILQERNLPNYFTINVSSIGGQSVIAP